MRLGRRKNAKRDFSRCQNRKNDTGSPRNNQICGTCRHWAHVAEAPCATLTLPSPEGLCPLHKKPWMLIPPRADFDHSCKHWEPLD